MYAEIYSTVYILQYSEAAVEEDLRYMLQPSRIHVGESVNVFQRGMLAFIFIVQHLAANHDQCVCQFYICRFPCYGVSRNTPPPHSRKTCHLWWSEWQHWYGNCMLQDCSLLLSVLSTCMKRQVFAFSFISASACCLFTIMNHCLYYCTGIIFHLEPSVFELLSRLEKKMSHVIKSVGNIEHEVYPIPR